MAVVGSKGAGWKVSSFTKSEDPALGSGCVADFRPVKESQLGLKSVECSTRRRDVLVNVHCHVEDCAMVAKRGGGKLRSARSSSVEVAQYRVQGLVSGQGRETPYSCQPRARRRLRRLDCVRARAGKSFWRLPRMTTSSAQANHVGGGFRARKAVLPQWKQRVRVNFIVVLDDSFVAIFLNTTIVKVIYGHNITLQSFSDRRAAYSGGRLLGTKPAKSSLLAHATTQITNFLEKPSSQKQLLHSSPELIIHT